MIVFRRTYVTIFVVSLLLYYEAKAADSTALNLVAICRCMGFDVRSTENGNGPLLTTPGTFEGTDKNYPLRLRSDWLFLLAQRFSSKPEELKLAANIVYGSATRDLGYLKDWRVLSSLLSGRLLDPSTFGEKLRTEVIQQGDAPVFDRLQRLCTQDAGACILKIVHTASIPASSQ